MSDNRPETPAQADIAIDMICPQCGKGNLTIQPCILVCENCGYVESCEDNFAGIQEDQ